MTETHSNGPFLAGISNATVPRFLFPSILFYDKPFTVSQF